MVQFESVLLKQSIRNKSWGYTDSDLLVDDVDSIPWGAIGCCARFTTSQSEARTGSCFDKHQIRNFFFVAHIRCGGRTQSPFPSPRFREGQILAHKAAGRRSRFTTWAADQARDTRFRKGGRVDAALAIPPFFKLALPESEAAFEGPG
jgi:hypothetical protein